MGSLRDSSHHSSSSSNSRNYTKQTQRQNSASSRNSKRTTNSKTKQKTTQQQRQHPHVASCKCVFWTLILLTQGWIIKLYHDAARSNRDGMETTLRNPTSSSSSQSSSSLYTLFERELIHQGIDLFGQQHQQPPPSPVAAGRFNGYPIYNFAPLEQESPNEQTEQELYSQYQCVGETWESTQWHRTTGSRIEQAWVHRSCAFQYFCYDTSTEAYTIFLNPQQHTPVTPPAAATTGDDDAAAVASGSSSVIHTLLQQQQQDKNNDKVPSFFDDTSTLYRNRTVIVNSNGGAATTSSPNNKYGDMSYGISIGSMNGKWGIIDGQRLKWFPHIIWSSVQEFLRQQKEYEMYTLPKSVILLPFHSLSAANPGHLVWDDFLPMFTLLEMFGFSQLPNTRSSSSSSSSSSTSATTMMDLLPIRHILPGERGQWAGCDWLDVRANACHKMLQKFGLLMGTRRSQLQWDHNHNQTTQEQDKYNDRIPITTNKATQLHIFDEGDDAYHGVPNGNATDTSSNHVSNVTHSKTSKQKRPAMICSRHALAGSGSINDHGDGTRGHGWEDKDYHVSHNSGRGGQLFNFRNYMVHNIMHGINTSKSTTSSTSNTADNKTVIPNDITDMKEDDPLIVLFSSYSSSTRGTSFHHEKDELWKAIVANGTAYGLPEPYDAKGVPQIRVEAHKFADIPLEQQVEMAAKASVFVTYCGGGAITAAFLPHGGSVVVWYNEKGGVQSNVATKKPARLDWDFFNNVGYLNVNWFPNTSRTNRNHLPHHTKLIMMELSRIHKQRKESYASSR